MDHVKKYVPAHRAGWYLQQLLKLYASVAIPEMCSYYLVIDADTIFLKPTTFFNSDQVPLYNTGSDFHVPYFHHMSRLYPMLQKQLPVSGICHHMMFNREILLQLFDKVSQHHSDSQCNSSKPFWQLFLELIDPSSAGASGASEYEIYFNYLLIFHKNNMCIRNLQWSNSNTISLNSPDSYISCHHYMATF